MSRISSKTGNLNVCPSWTKPSCSHLTLSLILTGSFLICPSKTKKISWRRSKTVSSSFPSGNSCLSLPIDLPLLLPSSLNQRWDVSLIVSPSRSRHKPLSVLSSWWGCIPLAAFSLSLHLPDHVWFSPLEQDLDQPQSLPHPYFLSRAKGWWAEWHSQPWDLPHLPWPPPPHCSTHGGVSHKGIFFIALSFWGKI